eukprot:CAMPEP_0178445442 /NCGR_PEP_ID=MMETSP0689_2-20121128/40165_1 /TAXON_ID=160604 /ORGANISM="Amphidinium massartii, Strain CS-259" /LENGTH=341 /DNA_ID=CAMNT_0020069985 /DNA_START=104 /DNA_END=1126 /DNA_ORIENTATION=+
MGNFKCVILVSLLLQNASYVLMLRFSQGVLKESYSVEECLLLGEVIKMAVALVMIFIDPTPSDVVGQGIWKVAWLMRKSQKMVILAIIYLIMNLLSYIALRRIDAAAFTVLGQLKILTTAWFSMLVLRRHISWGKWRALVIIVCGVILVTSPQLSSCQSSAGKDVAAQSTDTVEQEASEDRSIQSHIMALLFGYGAVLCQVTLSGMASIYFEKTIKTSEGEQLTLWQRNFQLASSSIVLFLGIILGKWQWYGHTLLHGWSIWALLVSILGALGGILVAFSVKYTDSITKSIAVSGSIVLSSCFGYFFLNGPMTLPMVVGCVTTIVATQSYTFDIDPDAQVQ